jgi:DNA topoisomerase-1
MSEHKEAVVRLKGTIATTEFFAESRQTTFAGWRIIGMPAAEDESEEEDPISVSTLKAGKKLRWTSLVAKETLTSPPPRFSEASLIRELEKKGIGRPSTYASLIETVLDRGYVEKTKPTKEKVAIKSVEVVAGAAPLRKTEYIEKSKGTGLQTTSLGRTVIEWLLTEFGALVDYGFTASMERRLDDVADSTLDKKVMLEDIWGSYKNRYSEIMAGSAPVTQDRGALGEGYKVIVTKKGPLFVLESDAGAQFAALPPTVSAKTATLADAKAAFADLSGTMLGSLEGKPVIQKKGKYGPYVTWTSPKGSNINLTYGSETFEEVCARLRAKIASDTVDHQIGPFRIKKGPYGLYMFKMLKTAKKPTFVSIPAETSWATLTVEGAEALYKASLKR